MRAAMATAAVGDDQFGEDPTINELQARVAALVGKEAALWVPSGTMANQVGLRLLTRPGDDIIVSRESHLQWYETGGAAANAGVQLTEVGSRGRFTVEDFVEAVKPRGHMTYPPSTVVYIENTHNRAGGAILALEQADRSAPRRVSARSPAIWTAPGCGTPRSRVDGRWPSSPRHSICSRLRCPRDWERRVAPCWPVLAI